MKVKDKVYYWNVSKTLIVNGIYDKRELGVIKSGCKNKKDVKALAREFFGVSGCDVELYAIENICYFIDDDKAFEFAKENGEKVSYIEYVKEGIKL